MRQFVADETQTITCPLGNKAWIQAPAYFGESCLFRLDEMGDPMPSLYSCVCFSRSEFVTLAKSCIDEVLLEFPDVGRKFAIFKHSLAASSTMKDRARTPG